MTAYHIAAPAVEEAIEKFFHIQDRYLDLNLPTYIVAPRGEGDGKWLLKEGFKRLVEELRPLGYLPRLRRVTDRYSISVITKPPHRHQRYRRDIILFAATVGTVFFSGFQMSNTRVLTRVLMPEIPVFVNALLFTLAILGIFGLHELGHKAMTIIAGIEASMPYFIPAPPPIGTFGAVIIQKEPPTNRDGLFDLGFSGPLVGFLVTIVVAVIGLRLSFLVSADDVAAWAVMFPEVTFMPTPFPLLVRALTSVVRPRGLGEVMMLHPVLYAAWVGCIVTFINLIPSWQLDGGHMSRALVGERNQRKISVAGIVLMVLSGFYIMAVMLVFFMMRSGGESGAPLDDISPLSLSRKLLSLVYLAMIILTMVTLGPF